MQRTSDVISEPNKINNTKNDITNKNLYVEPFTKNSAADNFRANIPKCLYHYSQTARARHVYALRIPKCISLFEHFEWNEKLDASDLMLHLSMLYGCNVHTSMYLYMHMAYDFISMRVIESPS